MEAFCSYSSCAQDPRPAQAAGTQHHRLSTSVRVRRAAANARRRPLVHSRGMARPDGLLPRENVDKRLAGDSRRSRFLLPGGPRKPNDSTDSRIGRTMRVEVPSGIFDAHASFPSHSGREHPRRRAACYSSQAGFIQLRAAGRSGLTGSRGLGQPDARLAENPNREQE